MPDSDLPEPVWRFLMFHIHSIEQMEVLLLLRNRPEREWTQMEITREISSSPGSIELRLRDLLGRRFIVERPSERGPVFHYGPCSEETRELIDGLAKAYRERRITVINLIYGKRSSDLEFFADAFTLAKKDKEE